MLNALEEAIPMIRTHEGIEVDLSQLPPDDPTVYRMLQTADTVGLFQVESRAQMASLPRNHPTRFYDLVVQVAIIRPGPIVGGMVHPYFERRQGREEVTYAHPSLEPVLERTLGIPLFQEQILRMAMVTAGFSGGEAEELRRAMGFKRSVERMHTIEERLRRGMAERGITGETQDQLVESITSFALYGFPESHAASFALIAYASAYLKAHHPTAFYVSLLNAWPMGFYHPATLIQDAKRRGVEPRPIDVSHSEWNCSWEGGVPAHSSEVVEGIGGGRPALDPSGSRRAAGALRLGLCYIKGLRERAGLAIEKQRRRAPFASLDDLARRCGLRADELDKLAWAGALASLGLTRREALWQVKAVGRSPGPLFDGGKGAPEQAGEGRTVNDERPSRVLPEMTRLEETVADLNATSVTAGDHPLAFLRRKLKDRGVTPAWRVGELPAGRTVRIAGSVIVRQRPGTAKGLLFVTLEDETGTVQAAIMPDTLRDNRAVIVRSPGLVIEGVVQKKDGSLSVRGDRFWPLALHRMQSHDFR